MERLSLVAALVFVVLISGIAAQDFYVATNGSGSSCNSTNPCATIQLAISAVAGTQATIHIATGTYTAAGNYALTFGSVSSQRITLDGPSSAIINCNGNAGFTVSGSQTLALSMNGLTMRNCRPALKFDGPTADGTFTGVTFDTNGASGTGGVSAVTANPTLGGGNFTPTFQQCTFSNNRGNNGAAIQISAPSPSGPIAIPANIIVNNCTFVNNTASVAGGAIHASMCCNRGSSFFTNLVFSQNSAATSGGTVYMDTLLGTTDPGIPDISGWRIDGSTLTGTNSFSTGIVTLLNVTRTISDFSITTSTITGGSGALAAAALAIRDSTVNIAGLTLTNNRISNTAASDSQGAALHVTNTAISITGATISSNQIGAGTVGRGAGVYLSGSGVSGSITDSAISANKAADGAAVYASGVPAFSFTNVTFSGNVAYRGAAAYLALASSLAFTNCPFTSNSLLTPVTSAQGFGGAVAANEGSTVSFVNSSFTTNAATYGGGAVYIGASSTLSINTATFTTNTATIVGGAIMMGSPPNIAPVAPMSATISGATFSSNQASSGGAIYSSAAATISIGGTTFSANTAAGSPQSQGGAIYIRGNASVSTVSFTLQSGVTFNGNSAPAGASLSLFGAVPALGAATLPVPPGQTVCCGNRCITCDSSSGAALTSSSNVTCPDKACPTSAPGPSGGGGSTGAANSAHPHMLVIAMLAVSVLIFGLVVA